MSINKLFLLLCVGYAGNAYCMEAGAAQPAAVADSEYDQVMAELEAIESFPVPASTRFSADELQPCINEPKPPSTNKELAQIEIELAALARKEQMHNAKILRLHHKGTLLMGTSKKLKDQRNKLVERKMNIIKKRKAPTAGNEVPSKHHHS